MSMSKIIGGMGVTLWADSRLFKKGLDEARTSLRKFSSEMPLHEKRMADWKKRQADTARTMTMFKGGLVALGAGIIYKVGQELEDLAVNYELLASSMNKALSVFGKMDKAQRRAMTQSAIGVSRSTLFSTDQAAQAMRFVGSAGYSAEDTKTLMPAFAQFAQAGQFDMAQAVGYAADSQAALGMKSADTAKNLENLTRVTDVLTKANILSNAEVEDFAQALTNKTAGALRLTNKSIEEGVAVLAAFAEQGVKGEHAGESLGIVMRDLQTKSLKNAAAFKSFGVEVFDSAGNMKNMADIIGDLESAMYGMSTAQKKQTLMSLDFTDRSVAHIQTLIGMSDKIRDYQKQLEDAGGVTKEVSDSIMTDHEKAVRRTAAAYDVLSERLGSYKTLWQSTKADFLENVTGTSGAEMAAAERQRQWKIDNNYLDPITGQDAMAEADALSGGLPNAEGRERIRQQIAERVRRRNLAQQSRDQIAEMFSGRSARASSGGVSGMIGSGLDFMGRGGQMVGNLFDRVRAAGESFEQANAQRDIDNFMKLGPMLSSIGDMASRVPGKRLGGFRLGDIGGAMNAPWNLAGMAGSAMSGLAGVERLKAKELTQASRPALSFAESGSAEAYRQQAAIRRQSENIEKKQLGVQERMESHLAAIAAQPPLMAANFR